ncbi:MAG: GGDEF domain-containing protein [Planctomycetota bacterium]
MSSIRILTADPAFFADVRAALGSRFDGDGPVELDALLVSSPGGTVVVDGSTANAFEACRRLAARGGTRIVFVLEKGVTSPADVAVAEPIARFCGASAVLARHGAKGGVDADDFRDALGAAQAAPLVPDALHGGDAVLPEALLRELTLDGSRPMELLERLADPETSLFNYEFMTYKLDEEFKRSRRFGHPLACVLLAFDGEAHEDVLRQLASIFLQACRDTDILGRFDRSSFLFLLPSTPPSGARIMAERVQEAVRKAGLRDLVGDRIELSIGVSSSPNPEITRAADLLRRAQDASREPSRGR